MTQPTSVPVSGPCTRCGIQLDYLPGIDVMRCPNCGYEQPAAGSARPVWEHPIEELGALPRKPVAQIAPYRYLCHSCGAHAQSPSLSEMCQFCAAPLVAESGGDGQIVPEAVLPFALDQQAAWRSLRTWATSRRFAPSALKRMTDASVRGIYVPHWTFDSYTVSQYQGARGRHYYTSSSSTDANGNTTTSQTRHTSWRRTAGEVRGFFDDVLVLGSGRLDPAKMTKLEPWPLRQSVAFHPDHLTGYQTLRYELEPEQAFELAKRRMDPVVRTSVRRDIGGDDQRITSLRTWHHHVHYKLMLLPVWLASYPLGGKRYEVLINSRTGAVLGGRPYSAGKIAVTTVAGVLLLIALITLIALVIG